MSSNLPPTNLEELSIFNPTYYTEPTGTGVSQAFCDFRYLIKTEPDTAIANETFDAGITTNTINTASGTLSIGATGASNIYIGSAGSNVTIYGSTTYLDITNLEVEDKNILVNKTGTDCNGAGLSVEKDGFVISSLTTDSSGNWNVNAPNNRLYLNEIQEKTVGNQIKINSDLDLNNNDVLDIGSLQGSSNLGLFIGHNTGSGTIDFYTQGNRRAQILSNGQVSLQTGLASSSSTTGTLVVTGGAGISGAIYNAGLIGNLNTTQASNSGSGAIATDGGISSLKNMWAGGKVVGEGGLASFSSQTAFKIQSTKLTPSSGNASWTFPSAYTSAPTITATAFLAGETNMRPCLITALSNTAVTVRCVKSDNSACENTTEIQVIAMGNA